MLTYQFITLHDLFLDAPVRDMIGAGSPDAPFYMKFLAGAITGGVGSVIGNRKYLLLKSCLLLIGTSCKYSPTCSL